MHCAHNIFILLSILCLSRLIPPYLYCIHHSYCSWTTCLLLHKYLHNLGKSLSADRCLLFVQSYSWYGSGTAAVKINIRCWINWWLWTIDEQWTLAQVFVLNTDIFAVVFLSPHPALLKLTSPAAETCGAYFIPSADSSGSTVLWTIPTDTGLRADRSN